MKKTEKIIKNICFNNEKYLLTESKTKYNIEQK